MEEAISAQTMKVRQVVKLLLNLVVRLMTRGTMKIKGKIDEHEVMVLCLS